MRPPKNQRSFLGGLWQSRQAAHDSLVEAAAFFQAIERRQGQRIAVPEEIAFINGWISREQLATTGHEYRKNGYGEYMLQLAEADRLL